MSERQKILERIRQLRAKTTSRGCTEAEAMAAAAKAAELMARLGLGEADIEIEEASSILSGKRHAILAKLWAVIGHCTNCAALAIGGSRSNTFIFIGNAPGPEVAAYLREVCDRAVRRELATFKAGTFYRRRRNASTRRAAIADFLEALVQRLSGRIFDLFKATISKPMLEVAAAARDKRFPQSTTVAFRERETRFGQAADEGWRAGARPNLAHGVGGKDGGPAGLIGSES